MLSPSIGKMSIADFCQHMILSHSSLPGVPLIDGGTLRLPALIGLSRAMDLILTGREIRAKEALEWGLANRVCDTGSGGFCMLNKAYCAGSMT